MGAGFMLKPNPLKRRLRGSEARIGLDLSPQAIFRLSSQQRIDSTESIAISLASLQGLLQDKERKLFVSTHHHPLLPPATEYGTSSRCEFMTNLVRKPCSMATLKTGTPITGPMRAGSGEASPMDEPRLCWADRPLVARGLSQPN